MQAAGSEAAANSEKVPEAHAMQSDEAEPPVRLRYLPAEQLWHDDAADLFEKVPYSHCVHEDSPASEA